MNSTSPRKNELIIAFIGGVGTDFDGVYDALQEKLNAIEYSCERIKISKLFEQDKSIESALKNASNLFRKVDIKSNFFKRYKKMQLGSFLRKSKDDNGYCAKAVIRQIFEKKYIENSDAPSDSSALYGKRAQRRSFSKSKSTQSHLKKTAFIIQSLKTKEEIEVLSEVYGKNFIAISIFEDESSRIQRIQKSIQSTHTRWTSNQNLASAFEELNRLLFGSDISCDDQTIQRLWNEIKNCNRKEQALKMSKFLVAKDRRESHSLIRGHGQDLERCFSNGHYIVHAHGSNLKSQIDRFVNILCGDPFAEPTLDEFFMSCAQLIAHRSLDLDRQVGCIVVNKDQEIVSMGFNDVSKVGGGHYSSEDHHQNHDQRDYMKGKDYNHIFLDCKVDDILKLFDLDQNAIKNCTKKSNQNQWGSKRLSQARENTKEAQSQKIRDDIRNQLKDITEFKRATHAEMSAILDAARRGESVRDCHLYVNTYPCHDCTKHMIASGITKVVYLHPYPKSKAKDMFQEMILDDEQHSLRRYAHGSKTFQSKQIEFKHFEGLSPTQFMQSFQNDASTRQEKSQQDREPNGHAIQNWKPKDPRYASKCPPYLYFIREYIIYKELTPRCKSIQDCIKDLGFDV